MNLSGILKMSSDATLFPIPELTPANHGSPIFVHWKYDTKE
jgi:hypothetical protein